MHTIVFNTMFFYVIGQSSRYRLVRVTSITLYAGWNTGGLLLCCNLDELYHPVMHHLHHWRHRWPEQFTGIGNIFAKQWGEKMTSTGSPIAYVQLRCETVHNKLFKNYKESQRKNPLEMEHGDVLFLIPKVALYLLLYFKMKWRVWETVNTENRQWKQVSVTLQNFSN